MTSFEEWWISTSERQHDEYRGDYAIAARDAYAAGAAAMRDRCAEVAENLRHPHYSQETDEWLDGCEAVATTIRKLEE